MIALFGGGGSSSSGSSSENTSSTRHSARSSNSSSASSSTGPQFATFLLPSFSIPFRKRRTASPPPPPLADRPRPRLPSLFTSSGGSSPAWRHPASPRHARHISVDTHAEPPSLSSSPGSDTSNPMPASPTSPVGFFPSFETASAGAKGLAEYSPRGVEDEAEDSDDLAVHIQTRTTRRQGSRHDGSHPDQAQQLRPPGPPATRLARTAPDILRCRRCATNLAFVAQIVSKGFTGRHGRAWLVAPPSAQATPSCPASPPPAGADDSYYSGPDNNLVNIVVGRFENRQLVTGAHVVADITCTVCGCKLGWKYVDARDPAQRYKVGKFILETARVVACRAWEDVAVPDGEDASATATTWKLWGSSTPSSMSPVGSVGGRRSSDRRNRRRHQDSAPDDASGGVFRSSEDKQQQPDGDGEGREEEGEEEEEEEEEEVVFDSENEDECEDIFNGVWDAEVVRIRRKQRLPRRPAAARKTRRQAAVTAAA